MPRIIFKCPYLKGGSPSMMAHLKNLVGYIATRDGTEKIDPGNTRLAATHKQKELVDQLTQSFPESMELFEYEDYLAAPNNGNASAFITMAIEQNLSQLVHREKYLEYIAKRPRAQRFGAHGLFTGDKDSLVLSQTAKEVAEHPGNVWLPIISLRREDAARLGYDNAENWRSFLSSYAIQMATAMKIPWEQFRWYAAFHNESHHPHIHMVCYSADPAKGFLTKNGIAQIKSGLAKHIFRQELTAIYAQQTQSRSTLSRDVGEVMAQLITQMQDGVLENSHIEHLVLALAQRLRFLSGKKQYGYLKAPMKSLVDEIVDELARDSRVAKAYDLWYEQREEVLRTYQEDLPARLPLSQQKEFKKIKNMVIQEALRLGELSRVFLPDGEQDDMSILEVMTVEEQSIGGLEDEEDRQKLDSPFAVDWSLRYKKARSFLFGSDTHPPDHRKAFALFQAEALAGNALAMCDLGRVLAAGLGCEADTELSQEWYAKALASFQSVEQIKQNCYVEYRIGKMYAAGLGTEQNYAQAAQWLALSAEHDNSFAAYALAKLLLDADGQALPDPVKALQWLRRSAELNNQFAQYRLGKLLFQGELAPKNVEEALRWLTASAQQGNQYAQYALGKLYLLGKDIPQDLETAIHWFSLAKAQGNEYAGYFIDHLDNPPAAPLFLSATRLLHHLGNIFREQEPPPQPGGMQISVDSKLLRKIREKKAAQGHKWNDHEPSMNL